MTKEDLVRNVTERSRIHLGRSLCQADVEAVFQALKNVTAQELTAGGEVPLPGLGKLKTKAEPFLEEIVRNAPSRGVVRRRRAGPDEQPKEYLWNSNALSC